MGIKEIADETMAVRKQIYITIIEGTVTWTIHSQDMVPFGQSRKDGPPLSSIATAPVYQQERRTFANLDHLCFASGPLHPPSSITLRPKREIRGLNTLDRLVFLRKHSRIIHGRKFGVRRLNHLNSTNASNRIWVI